MRVTAFYHFFPPARFWINHSEHFQCLYVWRAMAVSIVLAYIFTVVVCLVCSTEKEVISPLLCIEDTSNNNQAFCFDNPLTFPNWNVMS